MCSRAAAQPGRNRLTSRRRTRVKPGPPMRRDGDQFGFSIALSADGNTLAVGALTEDSAATGINGNQADNSAQSAGAVYVFTRTGTTWSQQAYVKSAQMDAGDMFGYAVALTVDGNILAVGAFDEDGSAPRSTARQTTGRMGPEPRTCSHARARRRHSRHTSALQRRGAGFPRRRRRVQRRWHHAAGGIAGRRLRRDRRQRRAVRQRPEGGRVDGCGLRFVRSDTTWSQQAFIKASNTGFNDWFGSKIALNGDGNVAVIVA